MICTGQLFLTIRQKGLRLDAYVAVVEQMQKKAKNVDFSLMTPEERAPYYLKQAKENQIAGQISKKKYVDPFTGSVNQKA